MAKQVDQRCSYQTASARPRVTSPPLVAGSSTSNPQNDSHAVLDGCALPPTETCGTRHLRASSTNLHARFPFPAIINSITIWDITPAPFPPRTTDPLANVSISVGHDATVTDCAIIDPVLPSASATAAADAALMLGFARKALLCSSAGTFATIRVPRAPSNTTGDSLLTTFAIKICITRLDAAAALREGTLWLPEVPQ